MKEAVLTEIKDQVMFIRLNKPEKRNAFSDEMLLQIEAGFSSIPDQVKCAIIYGEGQHFCAGLDLSELRERNVMEGLMHSRMWHRVLDAVQFGRVPVIAVLHGACVGGGLELAAACHIRIAEKSTFYALPEGQRGIFTGGGASVRLPRLIGLSTMTDMMLTGRVYHAEEGYSLGFSQYLGEPGTGLEKATEIAGKVIENTPMTNFALTHILPRIADASQDIGLTMESMAAAIAQSTPEAKQRLLDFLEGRAKKIDR